MATEVRVPTLGESVTEATVATWFKKPGEAVAVDEMLCELETDKVTVEVPSPAAGTLGEIVAAEGETVGVDALLAMIAEGGEAAAPAPKGNGAAKAETPASGGGEAVDVMVPTLGESVTEATVSTWFKAVGDAVAQDEMLCELETDKVSVEVPAPVSGILAEIVAPEGSTVDASARLAVISAGAGAAAAPGTEGNAPAEADPRISSAPRLDIDTPSLKGSISLLGGRIDELSLKNYRETIEPDSDIVELLSPVGSSHPYYALFGWAPGTGLTAESVPGANTLWQVEKGGTLTPDSPVRMIWDNGSGQTFRREIAVDKDFMFTVTQSVENAGQ